MKSKAAKNTETSATVNSNTLQLQSPVTRNKVRSILLNTEAVPGSPFSAQTSCESRKVQNNQENSMIARPSSVSSQTACGSSMMLGEGDQTTVITKGPKVICPNGHNCKFEEQNLIGNVPQNARGQNKTYTSVKCDATPSQVLQKPRERVEKRTYSSVRNETGSIITFPDLSPKISPVIRYADHKELQNRCTETKIADLRKGLQSKMRTEVDAADVGPRIFHQSVKTCSEIEFPNKARTVFMSVANSELTHQEQLHTTPVKEAENLVPVDRQMRDGPSNCDLRSTSAREAEQVPQLDMLSCKTNGLGPIGTQVATLTGNSLTIKSGTKEVVVVFMNPPQYINGRGGQTAESDRSNVFQEREIPAALKSVPAAATLTNTVDDQVIQNCKPEMPLQSTCHTTVNEANVANKNISCDKNSTIKVRDVKADPVNDDSYRHAFQRVQRPVPIIPHENRPLLSATATEPPRSLTVGASGILVEQSVISSNENVVDNKRNLVPVREESDQVFSSHFDARDAYDANTGNLIPVREVGTQAFPRNFCSNDVYTRNSLYQNTGLQMQFPCSVPSSMYREETDGNARSWLYENPAPYQHGRDQLSSHEDPISEPQYQTQMPVLGQHNIYGRLPSYGQHTIPNLYRDEFIDMASDPTYHLPREPIGVLRCRRLGSSYGGRYVYPLPIQNGMRTHRSSFLDRRPHIYHRRVYPEQPFYNCINDENLLFLNRY